MSSNTTINNTILMSRWHQCVKMAPLQHKKKCPNKGSYHCLGLNMCATSVTSPQWPQIATMDNEQGLRTGLKPCMFFFFLFFFLTNVNFELNTTSNSSMSWPHQRKTAPHSQKSAQMTVHTVIWAAMCVPHHHNGHKSPPWTTNGGSRPVLSPPMYIFFPLSSFFLC